jgi:hypothetical protein
MEHVQAAPNKMEHVIKIMRPLKPQLEKKNTKIFKNQLLILFHPYITPSSNWKFPLISST